MFWLVVAACVLIFLLFRGNNFLKVLSGILLTGIVVVGALMLMFNGTFERIGYRYLGTHQNTGRETFVSLSSSFYQVCGLKEDGSVMCWGDVPRGLPLPDEPLAAISLGGDHICGLRQDGSAACWGSDRWHQSRPPEDERFASLSVGPEISCGLREDGAAVCWGRHKYGGVDVPAGEKFASIDVGDKYACGLRQDGAAVCWGTLLHHPQVDGNELEGRRVDPPSDMRFSAISAAVGEYKVCGVRIPDGDLVCWGNFRWMPEAEPLIYEGEYVGLSAESRHACGLQENGQVECHGDYNAHCGLGSFCKVPPPAAEFSSIVSGREHVCGLRKSDGRATCWTWKHKNTGKDEILAVP